MLRKIDTLKPMCREIGRSANRLFVLVVRFNRPKIIGVHHLEQAAPRVTNSQLCFRERASYMEA